MLQDIIPAKYRKVIYSILGVAYAIETVLNVIPDGTQTKIMQVLAILGFTLAAGNTNSKP